ncbi:hypothetical protein GGX14DRAFT_664612 [Mycena pura]|uniref:Uncharacterized protein n=1 Tax=Mycena pura TaxID=153505 RepID=A0AAD6UZQ9_9AGAR|nr:hypothetical protein GGX14DRAFT_664612 [Mycena pura]
MEVTGVQLKAGSPGYICIPGFNLKLWDKSMGMVVVRNKLQIATTSKLDQSENTKTAKRFQLLHNPIEATDALWRAYANNRLAASSIRKRDEKAEAEGYESPESDDDDWFVRDDSIHVLRSIRRTMRGLEEQMLLPDGVLQKSVAVLNCEAAFDSEEADDKSGVSKTVTEPFSVAGIETSCHSPTKYGFSACCQTPPK